MHIKIQKYFHETLIQKGGGANPVFLKAKGVSKTKLAAQQRQPLGVSLLQQA